MRAAWALVLLALLPSVPAAHAQDGQPWTRTDFDVPAPDGVLLKASLWVPDAPGPHAAVLVTNGWNNRHDAGTELRFAERFAGQGYVVLGWTSRGWGDSGGEIELDGPKEVADARAMVDLLASRPEVLLDGPGDPRVGMVGESYAGGIQLLVAREEPRVDALIPRITWSNLLTALAPADVLKAGWVSELFATGQTVGRGVPVTGNPGGPNTSGPSAKLAQWYAASMATNAPTDEMRTEVGIVRSMTPGTVQVPTLLIQGWGDTLFDPSQALATYADLHARGVPARLVLYPGGHGQDLPSEDLASVFVDRVMDDWFARHLRGAAPDPSLPPYPVLRFRHGQPDGLDGAAALAPASAKGNYVGELQWPPAGTQMVRHFLGAAGDGGLSAAPAAASTQLVNPVAPATCTDAPSFQSQASFCPRSTAGTAAVWTTAALDVPMEVTGVPVAHLVVASTQPSDVRLFLSLVVQDEAGGVEPVLRQTLPVRLPSAGEPTVLDVPMVAISATVGRGQRLGLQVATTDAGFLGSREAGTVTLASSPEAPSWLDVPVVPAKAWGDHEAPRLRLLRAEWTNTSVRMEVQALDALGIQSLALLSNPRGSANASAEADSKVEMFGRALPDAKWLLEGDLTAEARSFAVVATDPEGNAAHLEVRRPPPPAPAASAQPAAAPMPAGIALAAALLGLAFTRRARPTR